MLRWGPFDPNFLEVQSKQSENDMIGYNTFDVLGSYCFPNLNNLPSVKREGLAAWLPLGDDTQY